MTKKYLIKDTTRVEREKIANDALGLSLLGANMPSNETVVLMNEYIEGKQELSDILQTTIQRYTM